MNERTSVDRSEADPPAPGAVPGHAVPPPESGAAPESGPPAAAAESPTPADDGGEHWEHFAPAPDERPGRWRRSARGVTRMLGHEWTLACLAGLLLAVVMTWPTLAHPTRTIPADIWDPTLQAWQMAWSGHALLTHPAGLFDANAFFPEPDSFAFSDTLLGYAPAGMIGTGPVAALLRYNIVFVLLFALAFVGGYALLRQLGSGRTGAAVAGAAIAFAPWRWGQAGHMHVLSTGGIVLALAMLARGHGYSLRSDNSGSARLTPRRDPEQSGNHSRRTRPGWALAGWLVAAWQITLGFGIGLPFAYALAAIVLVAALAWLLRGRPPLGRRLLLFDGIGVVVFAAVGVLMARPYFEVVTRHPYAKRGLGDLALFSPPLRGFFTGPAESVVWGDLHAGARSTMAAANEMAVLPGFTLYALAATGLFLSVWRLSARLWLLAGVLVSIALGMGTQFFGGTAGYLLLYRYLPGFDSIRTPGRLVVWTTILLAVLAAGAVSALVSRAYALAELRYPFRPGPLLRLVTLLPLVLVLAEGATRLGHPVVPGQPAALRHPRGPILVLPSDQLTDENVMLWSTTSFPKIVNGGSGFIPRGQAETRERTVAFPDPDSVAYLRKLGVRTVVVLRDRVPGTPYERAASTPVDGLGIAREVRGDTVIFDLG